jgi:hypothetical protein
MHSKLPDVKAEDFFDFMVNAPQNIYADWLPEEHHEFHLIREGKNAPTGNFFYFDQNIGRKHRMKFYATLIVAERPTKVVFQMRKFGITLPGFLDLTFEDNADSLVLTEQIRIGYRGIGALIDPFVRIVYSKGFFMEMDEHHKREWQSLAKCLNGDCQRSPLLYACRNQLNT